MNQNAILAMSLLGAALAGCGADPRANEAAATTPASGGVDESERRLITDLHVRACVERLTATIGNADPDKERLCTCATERLSQDKSLNEITRMPAQGDYDRMREQALASCRSG